MMRFLSTRLSFAKFAFSHSHVKPYHGKSYDEIRKDRAHIMPADAAHYYKEPVLAVQGHKEFVYDDKGKEYIDLIGGISCMNIGHSHPRLNKIFKEQAPKLLSVSSHYVNEYQGLYA